MKALITVENHDVAVKEVPQPKPGPGEILVKVSYVAQNPTDWKGVASSPPGRIPGCDFAGTVEDANGSQWKQGQRVAGFVYGQSTNPDRGAFAEFLVTEASLVFAVPDSVSFQEAAVVPLAFGTAVQVLFQRMGLPEPTKPASSPFSILINGGTSSVGIYAVQLAKLAGLRVIATGSKKNHEFLKELGADVTIDYRDSDWVDQVRAAANGELKHAFDAISESTTLPQVAKALWPGGHVLCILPRKQDEIDSSLQVTVESTIVYTVFERALPYLAPYFENCGEATPQDKAVWEEYLGHLSTWLNEKKIRPNPIKEYGSLEDIPKGFKLQQDGGVSAEKLVYKIA